MMLLYGRGWISSLFEEILMKNDIQYTISDVRVDDTDDMIRELDRIKPSHCICMIGRTSGENMNSIDYLEDKPYINIRDNLYAPVSLGLECKKRDIHYTYLGTGCIFTYDVEDDMYTHTYNEDDLPNFFGSHYSLIKGYTDRLMHQIESLNLRIRMPISSRSHKRNLIDKLISYENICSIPNSMTVLDDFLPVILDMILHKRTGTYNLCNPGVIEHNEILNMYKEYVNDSHTWKNFNIEEQDKILKSKRSNNHLDTSKITSLYDIPDIKTSVRHIMMKYH